MKSDILRLSEIAHKPSRRIIGLMSGTSLDGLDIACCLFTGYGRQTKVQVEAFETIPYTDDFKNEIKTIFGQKTIDFEQLTLLNPYIALHHAELIRNFLQKYNISSKSVDVIASHGQTVFHAPAFQHQRKKFGNATLQIGDGDTLAVQTGIITLSDFRQKHIAGGGEGAPLAVYGDYYLFGSQDENRILINMGGIGNFTYLPKDENKKILVSDVGPCNTIMDAYCRQVFQVSFDKNGDTARKGTVHKELLDRLLQHYFHQLPFPKSTGPEVFNLSYLEQCQKETSTQNLEPESVLSTLTAFSTLGFVKAIESLEINANEVTCYLSGGGMHNSFLVDKIKSHFPTTNFQKIDSLEISGDAKEAVLFAVLANETLSGEPNPIFKHSGIPGVSMGKISLPN